ncbi:DUF7336 domain-containing protein [Lactococcus cremoris]|uniref:DUF7336 domain-containing protein n=1 Tax=Lactococcus lactis subsp. cremoris TaxID=1359 RepID=UPI0003AB815A|nr:hypothetical protein [Lactococcus cremoris]AGV72430.1 hypothetical protein kw2_0449 [Lactococcus cremoris subsp. cremoris KW2]MCD6631655.1 hypothetical protein [Lactococcus cremoris]
MKVYMLKHSYSYEIFEGIMTENGKFIGTYRTEEKAKETIKKLKLVQGFNRFPENCFQISTCIVGEEHWTKGFIPQNGQEIDNSFIKVEKDTREIGIPAKLYSLEHTYEYEIVEDIKLDETKFIGVYKTELEAIAAKEKLLKVQGFNQFPEDSFNISEEVLDEDNWTEGFITWDGETQEWIE